MSLLLKKTYWFGFVWGVMISPVDKDLVKLVWYPCTARDTCIKKTYQGQTKRYTVSWWDCNIVRVRAIVFNATFKNISAMSWGSVLLVEETGVHRENHRPATCYWQALSHNVVSSTPRHERNSNSQYIYSSLLLQLIVYLGCSQAG